jgi:hypothetical protein
MDITATHARRMRWHAQLLGGSALAPADVTRHMVALQGQDLPAVLRAVALRAGGGTTVADVVAAFDAGELVRSWPMRGTLFATTPDDLAVLLSFTGDRIRQATVRRRAQLDLDDRTIGRARDLALEAVAGGGLRRSEMLAVWESAGISTEAGRGYHLLMHLCVEGLMHWGPFAPGGGEQLLTRSDAAATVDPDAALAGIVRRYITARQPVTLTDLAWWTKLPKTALRRVAASVDDLVEVTVDGQPAWVIGEPGVGDHTGVTLVPGFDEWILGYGDRSLVASPSMLEALVPGSNGVFRPAVLVDGVVVGTWRPARGRAEAVIDLVEKVSAATSRDITRAVADWPHG